VSTISRKAVKGIALAAASALVLAGCAAAQKEETADNSDTGSSETETETEVETVDNKLLVSDEVDSTMLIHRGSIQRLHLPRGT
jgi:hypothetical protein